MPNRNNDFTKLNAQPQLLDSFILTWGKCMKVVFMNHFAYHHRISRNMSKLVRSERWQMSGKTNAYFSRFRWFRSSRFILSVLNDFKRFTTILCWFLLVYCRVLFVFCWPFDDLSSRFVGFSRVLSVFVWFLWILVYLWLILFNFRRFVHI